MTLAAAVAPLAVYAVAFQTVLYFSLPSRLRTRVAPLVTGFIGASVTLGAALIFGPEDIGLAGGDATTIFAWGGVAVVVVSSIGLVMLSRGQIRDRLADQPIARLGNFDVITQVFVRIPVFTALIEEAFFRGVLHAALVALYPAEVAIWLGAGLFGLWHIGPGVDQALTGAASVRGRALHTGVIVVATTVAGAFLVWLRIETGSIWAPVAVHAVVNMTLAGTAWLAGKRSPVAV